jgi:ABC-type cobalamin/Fe3+-siderophores transport system ATPase subunit
MLEFKNIEMIFNNTSVLKNISSQFISGKFIAIIGQNGSGKSTLMRILSGLQKPTKGSVYFFNKDLSTLSEKKLSTLRTYVSSEHHCHWNLLAEDIVALGLLNTPLSDTKKMENVYEHMKNLEGSTVY